MEPALSTAASEAQKSHSHVQQVPARRRAAADHLDPSRFTVGFDEDLRDLGDDGIAVTAQSSHAGGYPMSQRECAGFNLPRFPVGAGYPICGTPEICPSFDSLGLFLSWLSY